ncbi:MAG: hypothetical protein IJZ95_04110 [Oscillospiraceae bacterium]|nr:hypothetical protein [Oscillospiraceae bacterium]
MIITTGKVNLTGLLAELGICPMMAADNITQLYADRSVLVLGRGAKLPEKLSVFAVVADADEGINTEGLKGSAVVTCGMGSRNTVSVSSRTAERITLALNRSIPTLNGACDPMELPVSLREGISDYEYMAAFAALLLLDKWHELQRCG